MKFQTFGCVAAIAVSSLVSEIAKGKKLDEAQQSRSTVYAFLKRHKIHYSLKSVPNRMAGPLPKASDV